MDLLLKNLSTTVQSDVEKVFSKQIIRSVICETIQKDHVVFELMCIQVKEFISKTNTYYKSKQDRIYILAEMGIESIVEEILITTLQIDTIQPIQASCALIGARIKGMNNLDGVLTATELLGACQPAGAYTIYNKDHGYSDRLSIRSNYKLDADVIEKINKTRFLPPMLCKPMNWINNSLGGYIHEDDSVILGNLNFHNKPQNLKVINILQDIEWKFTPVVQLEETPSPKIDTSDKLIQFNHMKKESREIYEWLINTGNRFYFTWKYDKRGRMYTHGYHVNLQGTEYKKATISFAKAELIQ